VYYEDPAEGSLAQREIADQMVGNHLTFTRRGLQMYPPFWREELSAKDERHRGWIRRMEELRYLDPVPASPKL